MQFLRPLTKAINIFYKVYNSYVNLDRSPEKKILLSYFSQKCLSIIFNHYVRFMHMEHGVYFIGELIGDFAP